MAIPLSVSAAMKAPTVSGAGSSMTTMMQDQQARNKPLLNADEDEGSDITKSRHLSYEVLERRRKAALILDSPELLMTYAVSMGDSLAGVRQIFTKILCGYEDKSTEYIWGGLKTGRVPRSGWGGGGGGGSSSRWN